MKRRWAVAQFIIYWRDPTWCDTCRRRRTALVPDWRAERALASVRGKHFVLLLEDFPMLFRISGFSPLTESHLETNFIQLPSSSLVRKFNISTVPFLPLNMLDLKPFFDRRSMNQQAWNTVLPLYIHTQLQSLRSSLRMDLTPRPTKIYSLQSHRVGLLVFPLQHWHNLYKRHYSFHLWIVADCY